MKFIVEYRLKGKEKSYKTTVREGEKSMRLPKPDETYELRDVARPGGWQECKTDDSFPISATLTPRRFAAVLFPKTSRAL